MEEASEALERELTAARYPRAGAVDLAGIALAAAEWRALAALKRRLHADLRRAQRASA